MPDFDSPPIPLARPGAVVRVFRYDPEAEGVRLEPLPNVRCLAVQHRLGPEPAAARFRYMFDDVFLDDEFPNRVEDVLSIGAKGVGIVRQDDRIVVTKDDADGGSTFIFDGYAQVPQADLASAGEMVTFAALAVSVREWDTPLAGAIHRDGDDPSVESDVVTGLPTRFNPDGRPNCIPDAANSGDSPWDYPIFFDSIKATDDRTHWSVAKAARYIVAVGNPDDTNVVSPDFDDMDDLLLGREPIAGEFYDPNDEATYITKTLRCQDFDATGEAWPVALSKLIEPHGFSLVFRLGADDDGNPQTWCELMRRDGGGGESPKKLYLQEIGSTLDPALTNVSQVGINRDGTGFANRVEIDSAPVRYEASFVLAPGFAVASGDASDVSVFDEGSPSFASNYDKYRTFIFDETGDGHWDWGTAATVESATSLDDVLGEEIIDPLTGATTRRYAVRRRPGIDTLLSLDSQGKPKRAELWLSTDYAGAKPGVWDKTGTWQKVSGSWALLRDRLGIRLTVKQPDDLSIEVPPYTGSGAASVVSASGKIRVVKALASADTPNPRFHFRLTCCIDADQGLGTVADWRPASPTSYSITRRVDARDRFRKQVVSKWSHLNTTNEDTTARDDSDTAEAYAKAMRAAHEAIRFAGSATIPRFTLAYQVGDLIDKIEGRGLSLAVTAAADQGEGARYPMVAGISWEFDGRQSTTLHLEDRRAEPAARRST